MFLILKLVTEENVPQDPEIQLFYVYIKPDYCIYQVLCLVRYIILNVYLGLLGVRRQLLNQPPLL